MSPFRSKQQMKAAFSGGLGPEMKEKAKQWAAETPNIKTLPSRVSTFNVKNRNGTYRQVTRRSGR